MNKKNLFFLSIGIVVFLFVLYSFGENSLLLISKNINYFYLTLFISTAVISFVPYTLRFKTIVDSYGNKTNLFRLIKHSISTFAVSYITPASRLGGEPVRIMLLKKEEGVDYKVGTASVILDKFVEIFGSLLYGVIGIVIVINFVSIPMIYKTVFAGLVLISLLILGLFYISIVKGKNPVTKLFLFLRLNKIKKFSNGSIHLEEIDQLLKEFFTNKKKVFLKSFMFYIITGILFIIEFKLLLLSIGINTSIFQTILMINIWGLMNFVPTPSSMGFMELGQIGLFKFLNNMPEAGLSMVLILRVGYLFVTLLGFYFLIKLGFNKNGRS